MRRFLSVIWATHLLLNLSRSDWVLSLAPEGVLIRTRPHGYQEAGGYKTGIWERLACSSVLAPHTEHHKQVRSYGHGKKNLEADELAVSARKHKDGLCVFQGLSHTGQPWLGTAAYCPRQGSQARWEG